MKQNKENGEQALNQVKQFKMSEKFLAKYQDIIPPFGFNGLGYLVYMRTYSRIKENGENEMWWETVARVVEGTYRMQQRHMESQGLAWDAMKAQKSAQEMFDRIFNMKFLPPGRGLWAMGSPITEEKGIFAALNNCAFTSTENLKEDLAKPFTFLMDASMLGVGVGFDTKGAGQLTIKGPNKKRQTELFVIPDTREGWVESLKLLLESYFLNTAPVNFDYSQIRPAGVPIKGFGGVASGPDPLKDLHRVIGEILDEDIGKEISSTAIVDIMNLIGKCVVAGNVRRTAEIVFGEVEDEDYLDLKNYKVNPHRAEYGWTSNNSVFAKIGMNYKDCAERTRLNGEPGYAWLDNMRSYSRMNNGPDNKDHRVSGGNPCLEQSLESMELCCLVETFPHRHTDVEDYKKTLKYAYLYAKTVTLGKTHWPETNRVMLRNRRIGCSMSGIAQFITQKGLHDLKTWCEEGYKTIQYYDQVYSDWLAIPRSIKTTSIKPSGTVSLLAGATPGMHYPESRFYIRRVRVSKHSPLLKPLRKAGYKIEPAFGSEDSTVVVEIPVDVGDGIRTISQVSIWEQFALAAFLQRYWADNQVSCTVTFNPGLDPDEVKEFATLMLLKKLDEKMSSEQKTRMAELGVKYVSGEGHQIEHCLNYFQYQLKGISLLPRHAGGAYPQMPYEEINEDSYLDMCKKLKKLDFSDVSGNEAEVEKFCDGEACVIEPVTPQQEGDSKS
jgi:ribonucleoside-triphosphate reductase